MSGIVGILNRDGAPVERDLISRLTNFLSFRGPDTKDCWIKGNVAFGHTLLRSTWEAETEHQPLTLDGNVWLTADARLDGRSELIAKLENKLGAPLKNSPNDAELILHAYKAWQEDCVKHLLGDFAFAIWDAGSERLFCARDQLGVRQFYYNATGDCFVFSNTLNCLRLHPRVSNTLNERAVGDFLVFGLNQEKDTTAFADIQRLPRAHTLVVSREGLRVSQYWSPSTSTIHYQNDADYVERFRELLNTAVTDRVRTQQVAISLSGGLDSPAVAAAAKSTHAKMSGCCVVYDSAFRDDERKYATVVADALDIPLEFLDGNEINQKPDSIGIAPEPFDVEPIYAVAHELVRCLAARARVALTGWDGDTFLNENPRHSFVDSMKRGNFGRLFADMIRFTYFQRSPPPIGIRTQWRRWRNPNWNQAPFPVWINEDFAKRLHLVERWRETSVDSSLHPLRPLAFRVIHSPSWDSLFSRYDAGTTLLPLEVRHPLIDLRMVDYLLALPIVPWLLDKWILRKAMEGILPDAVRQRPKSPLAGDPGLSLRHTKKFQEIDQFQPVERLASYVDRKSIPGITQEINSNQLSINVRPFSLNQWLTYSQAMEPTHDI
ncbi:MAG TPA: asparagine synthase-related protein [Pyrinomonadaceae bacterium]|nr:asparagine synthase-related protein [Pyrinomonadaceae bacterium]